jgi:histidinol dehydrogenase
VQKELKKQVEELPRKEYALQSLSKSRIVVLPNINDAIAFANEYAAEHLIIACENVDAVAGAVTNAGSVFLGNYSPESVGDYASGTNHVLPTNGTARAYSGVSVDSFVKKITYQQLSSEGLNSIGNTVMRMARAEGLEAHARAVEFRINN